MKPNLPSPNTLRKYGITLDEWLAFLPTGADGDPYCPVCSKSPSSGRYVVDHEHVRGWKTLPPEERKKYVRGVVCTTCNHYVLTRYGTVLKHRLAAKYLAAYERRKNGKS